MVKGCMHEAHGVDRYRDPEAVEMLELDSVVPPGFTQTTSWSMRICGAIICGKMTCITTFQKISIFM